MPLRTDTIELDAELDRLREEKDAKAAEQIDFPAGSDGAQQAAQEGQQADRFLSGVAWAMQAHDDDSAPFWTDEADAITFGALTNGERHLVSILVDGSKDTADAMRQNVYVAIGTRDAPFVEHDPAALTDPEERAAIKETAGHIANVHPAFADWAEQQIAELDRVGADTGKSYRELVQEKRRQETLPSENG